MDLKQSRRLCVFVFVPPEDGTASGVAVFYKPDKAGERQGTMRAAATTTAMDGAQLKSFAKALV